MHTSLLVVDVVVVVVDRWQNFVGVEKALGVEDVFELVHHVHRLLGLAVVDEVLLFEAKTVLCTDAPFL